MVRGYPWHLLPSPENRRRLFLGRDAIYAGRVVPRQIGSPVPERPSGRLVGGLSAGLLLGMLGGWLAGLLRAPRSGSRP
jgi:predicted lipid-binding transport protein (Tim44 family)